MAHADRRGRDDPTVDADPEGTEADDYAASKRGAELAVLDQLPRPCAAGPGRPRSRADENVGRLPWWLQRLARGGRVVAPGPPDRPLQFIDARDLARWMLSAADRGIAGAFNTVSRPGHTTIGALLDVAHRIVGSSAELVWVSPETIAAADVSGWTELPIWVPPSGELAALLELDVTAALARACPAARSSPPWLIPGPGCSARACPPAFILGPPSGSTKPRSSASSRWIIRRQSRRSEAVRAGLRGCCCAGPPSRPAGWCRGT